jgi:YVTN family beta-propeller protein
VLKTTRLIIVLSVIACSLPALAKRPQPESPPLSGVATATQPSTLFNGWGLSPAGTHLQITNMPLKMVLSPDGQTLAAVCGGLEPGLALIDAKSHTLRQFTKLNRAWNGVAWSSDGKHIYVSGGNSPRLYRFDVADGRVGDPTFGKLRDQDAVGDTDFLAGVAIHPKTGKVYVCNEARHEVMVVDPATLKLEATIPVGQHPHSCVLGAGGRFLYVSQWGARSVGVIDTTRNKRVVDIEVGIRPNDMAIAPDGRLFVACAGDNTVHVINTQHPETEKDADEQAPPSEAANEIISTSLYPSAPEGSTPDAVAITPDGKTLVVANADNNDVAVIDISKPVSLVRGFIPVGWYPTAIACDNQSIYVANGKGLGSRPSVPVLTNNHRNVGGVKFDYISGIIEGWVSFIDRPGVDTAGEEALGGYTQQVRKNSPYTPDCFKKTAAKSDGPIPDEVGKPSPIKHILYIIKENRTYDQVLGDMKDASGKPLGNGDPKLCIFGQDITPNQHELARQYVLLDNLFSNSEVSVDGHSWCDGALATDYRQRKWTVQYTGHGKLPGNQEMDEPSQGFLWDLCKRNGVSFKCYGEGNRDVPMTSRGTWPGGRDMNRVDGFIKDLHDAEKTGDLPKFMIMALGENHTRGTTPGWFTPQACVASNDIGVGKIVEAASKSKFWNEMAIFIIEDDTQNGPDHVDAHRTTGLVISPFTKRGIVDSTPYTTTSMVRTMELILGMPPMTQYDAGATPMFGCFQTEAVAAVYSPKQPKIDLNAKNKSDAPGAKASAAMDFDEVDEAPEDELNRILWAAMKGADEPYPAPIHRAVFFQPPVED